MNIMFLISCINYKSRGNGGHYYDLITFVKGFENLHKITTVTIGTDIPASINGSGLIFNHISLNKWNLIKVVIKLRALLKNKNIELIHSFDDNAYYFARLAMLFSNVKKNVLTLPGGGNPKIYYPFSTNLIVFSIENYEFFRNWSKYKGADINCIPNRVLPLKQDTERITELLKHFKLERFEHIFLRITRITGYNLESIQQSIALVKKLKRDQINCALVVIGVVENINLFKILVENSDENIFFETRDRYTINASELIDIAGYVIGTGRGFMEASLQRKIMLAPAYGCELPVLADEDNIDDLFSRNFSQRYQASTDIIQTSYNKLFKILTESSDASRLKEFILKYSELYFALYRVTDRYCGLYASVKKTEHQSLTDIFLHSMVLFKRLLIRGKSI